MIVMRLFALNMFGMLAIGASTLKLDIPPPAPPPVPAVHDEPPVPSEYEEWEEVFV